MLVLDDGTVHQRIHGNLLLFEAIEPDPPLMGMTPSEVGIVNLWQRRVELRGYPAVLAAFRNRAPGFRNRALPGPRPVAQILALDERGRVRYGWFLEELNARLTGTRYIVGTTYNTVADVTALVTIDFASRALKMLIPIPSSTSIAGMRRSVCAPAHGPKGQKSFGNGARFCAHPPWIVPTNP